MTALRDLDLILVTREHLNDIGPLTESWLTKACEFENEWSPAELKQGIAEGRFHLWACWRKDPPGVIGAGITCFSENKAGLKTGRDVVFAAEGGMATLIPLMDRVEEFFALNGCDEAHLTARLGVAKHLRQRGYRDFRIVMRKALKKNT
jgi:hypothetical protein